MIKLQIIKRLKLLFLDNEILDFVTEMNENYVDVEEYCKKKKWKIYDNIHNNLNIIESSQNEKSENTTDLNKSLKIRTINVVLKIFFTSYKNI